MATIGLMGFWTGGYKDEDGVSYIAGKKIGKAITVNETYNVSTATLYADNGKDDEIKTVIGGTIEVTPDDISPDEFFPLMGLVKSEKTVNGVKKEVYRVSGGNEGGFMGVGIYENRRNGGSASVIVTIYTKVKFSVPTNRTSQTMGETATFSTPSVTGTLYPDKDGDYCCMEAFDTEDEAVEFLNEFFGIEEE